MEFPGDNQDNQVDVSPGAPGGVGPQGGPADSEVQALTEQLAQAQ